jgi:hypothetical protein
VADAILIIIGHLLKETPTTADSARTASIGSTAMLYPGGAPGASNAGLLGQAKGRQRNDFEYLLSEAAARPRQRCRRCKRPKHLTEGLAIFPRRCRTGQGSCGSHTPFPASRSAQPPGYVPFPL